MCIGPVYFTERKVINEMSFSRRRGKELVVAVMWGACLR